MPNPIVLVHGIWFGGWSWRRVAEPLRAAGHEVHAPSLTGCGDRRHLSRPGITLDTLGQDVAGLIEFEDLRQVTLVATSSGGLAAARAAELVPDRIGHLVLVDALIPRPGESAVETVPLDWQSIHDPETDSLGTPPASMERLKGQLSSEDAAWIMPRLTTFPRAPMTDPVDLRRFWQGGWPATVVFCRRTVNPPEPIQRRTADLLKGEWRPIDSGHYPFFTNAEELAKVIEQAGSR